MKNSYLTLLVSIICIGTSNAQNSFPVPSGVVRINEKSGINRLLFQEIAEPNGEGLVSMITGQQRGLLIKDRTNSKGGLWLIGAGSTSTPISAGGIGAGLVGDMATYIALAPNTSAITFLDGRINFFANKGFSAGQRYWPTPKMILNADGNLGIGTVNSPVERLHVRDGQLMTSDGNFDNINLRVDGRSLPTLRFTRWIGSGSIQHNAFVGQFFNTALSGEYSLGIGTGYSATGDQNSNSTIMTFTLGGKVGIGTTNPGSYKLAVAGKIAAWDEIKVFTNGSSFPDYVFDPSYKLRSLEETEKYVKENHHLPEVPSAAEVAKEGMSLNGMSEILLKKVEELTLYIIEQNKRIEALEKKLKEK